MRRQTQSFSPRQDGFVIPSSPTYSPPYANKGDHDIDNLQAKTRRTNSYGLLPLGVLHHPHKPRSRVKRALRTLLHPPRIWRSRLRFFLFLILVLLAIDTYVIIIQDPPAQRIVTSSPSSANSKPKIYVAGIHRNSEKILRTHWNRAILDLVSFYGANNLFVSLHESGSIDGTKTALRHLDASLEQMGVRKSIVLDPTDQILEVERHVTKEEEGWVFTKRGKFELRRIPYLAALRNRVMEKLLQEQKLGRSYDFVVWVNDVVFNVEDIATLLSTHNGTFDAACSLDFKKSYQYYDTFALRSMHGSKVSPRWPYFSDSISRKALRTLQPVRVSSCWNGIVAFPAESFYQGLKFRGISDDLAKMHLEASECCLIHNDIRPNSHERDKRIYVNPNVRVGYDGAVYESVNPAYGAWPRSGQRIFGIWSMRLGGPSRWVRNWAEQSAIARKISAWQLGNTEKLKSEVALPLGQHCFINEMQVLEGAGWRHL